MKKGGRRAKWEAGPHAMWAPLDMSDPYHPAPFPSCFFFFTTPSPLPRALVPFSPPHVHHSACLLQQQESGRAMPSLLMLIARAQREKAPLHSQREKASSEICC